MQAPLITFYSALQKEEQVRIIPSDNSKYFKLELPGILGHTYSKKKNSLFNMSFKFNEVFCIFIY